MASTVKATLEIRAGAVETIPAADLPALGLTNLSYGGFDLRAALSSTTTPPVSKVYGEKKTSSTTLDLTALVRSLGTTPIDGTGLKVQFVLVNNLSTTQSLTVADGDSNAYQLQGGQSMVVPPGGTSAIYANDKLADIDATHKNVKFTITGAESYEVLILMG